jgi:hypothetical protein
MEEIQVVFRMKKMLQNKGQKKICTIERRAIKNEGKFKLKYNHREVVQDKDTHGELIKLFKFQIVQLIFLRHELC